jgi:hypothetical protein
VGAPPWRYIALVGALSMASLWFGSGIDSRALACFVAFAAAVGWVGWRPALAGDATAQALTSLVSAAIAYAMLRPGEFLDNGVYVLGALLLAAFQWGATLWRDARDAACTPAPVCERAPEEDQYRNVVFIKAEGNYAQVRAIDGAKLFLRQTLSEFPLSGQFVRVHRSYIVNLAHAQRLVANTGSRYHLELTDGASVPVSRKLVNLVRERLSNASPARP